MKAIVTALFLAGVLINTPNASAHGHEDHGKDAEAHASIAKAKPGLYIAEPTHAYITFQYQHLGFSNPTVAFRRFDAKLDLNPGRPEESSVDVVIDAASIESLVPVFNEHLRAPDFFDTTAHPKILFRSTGAFKLSEKQGRLQGDLTIKEVTKPVTLDVSLNKVGINPITKKETIGISATAVLNRSEWGLGAYAPAVSDEVRLNLEIEFVHDQQQ